MDFDRIIAPMTREEFLSRHWEQSWLHLKGAPGRFTELMPWDELNRLLANARLAPPLLRLSQNGETLPSDAFMHTPPGTGHLPRMDAGKVAVLLAQGATLVLHMVEDISPAVRALARAISETLQGRSYVNLYASWKTQRGVDLHWDAHEVLMLQVQGRKRWQIHAPTQEHPLDAGVPPMPKACSSALPPARRSPGPASRSSTRPSPSAAPARPCWARPAAATPTSAPKNPSTWISTWKNTGASPTMPAWRYSTAT